MNAGKQLLEMLATGNDPRAAYALPAIRPDRCPKCNGRTWGSDRGSVCRSCRENPTPNLRILEVPAKYRWAKLEAPITPPDWTLERPLIPEQIRTKALLWANGNYDGPKNALTIAAAGTESNPTGIGKSSLAAAVAMHISERRKLTITWVHASELRADVDGAREAMRRLLNAPLSVLDGLGKELAGAHDVPGWQPGRMSVMMDYATQFYQHERGIRITTIDLPGKTLVEVYKADFVRRFGRINHATNREENATIIRL